MEQVLIAQSFTHLAKTEKEATQIVEEYKSEYNVKKATVDRKVKKQTEYWKVYVVVESLSEKDAFELYFDIGE